MGKRWKLYYVKKKLNVSGTSTLGSILLYTLTGTSNPGVIQHATGLLFCISSTHPISADANKLMALHKNERIKCKYKRNRFW